MEVTVPYSNLRLSRFLSFDSMWENRIVTKPEENLCFSTANEESIYRQKFSLEWRNWTEWWDGFMDLKGAKFSLFFILICILSSRAERDSLLQGHQLKDGEYVVSAGKVFSLRFFTPISRQMTNGYLSPEILRHNRYRDTPIPDTSGSLKIDDDGRLEILQNGKTLILLSSKLASMKQTSMALMDTGNLVLSEVDSRLLRLWTVIGTAIFLSVLFIAYICYSLWKKLKMDIYIRQLYYFLRRKVRAIGKRITEDRTSFVELGTTTSYSAIRRRKLKVLYYKSHGLRLFTLENLSQATYGFSPSNKLGQGGFGTVYKGKLEGGQEVAVKRLSRSSKQGVMEFKNELKAIAKLQHTNLAAIIGCCVERGEKIVVYEYMPNKSLDFFLFDPNRKVYLDWRKRFNVIEGIAQGLLYLHKYSTLKIIHRDLKAANILLDEEMNAKISDFGMARIFGRDESQFKTKRIVGTHGYMSPEYLMGGNYSEKSDIFSFGVMMIEIVSGKKNYGSYHPDRPLNLIGQAWELWTENRESELIDETLAGGLCDKEQALRCIHVGLLCAQEKPSDRPSISDVVAMISNGSIRLDPPNRPGFLLAENPLMKIEELDQEESFNVASISEEVGR